MNEPDIELLEWKDAWQRSTESPAATREVSRRLARAQLESIIVRIIEGAVATSALALVALALMHAANAFEAALGLLVAWRSLRSGFSEVEFVFASRQEALRAPWNISLSCAARAIRE
jgi:hypothetical protein